MSTQKGDLRKRRFFGMWSDLELQKLEEEFVIVKDLDSSVLLSKIRDLVQQVDDSIRRGEGFSYTLPLRASDQVVYVPQLKQLCLRREKTSSCVFGDPRSAHRATVLTAVLSIIQQSLISKELVWSRSIYYCDPALFENDDVTSKAVFDLSCMLGCSRGHLNIVASSKGLFIGKVTLVMGNGDKLYGRPCAVEPMAVPVHSEDIKEVIGEYAFILVVEKKTVFHQLVQAHFHDTFNCVIVTGAGQPDVSTRSLVHKLYRSSNVPVYGFFDPDPYGIQIFCTYKYGSEAMSFDNVGLTVPDMRWIGVGMNDLTLRADSKMLLPLSDEDISLLKSLQAKDYIEDDPILRAHILTMMLNNKKGEIEFLRSKGGTKTIIDLIVLNIEDARTREYGTRSGSLSCCEDNLEAV